MHVINLIWLKVEQNLADAAMCKPLILEATQRNIQIQKGHKEFRVQLYQTSLTNICGTTIIRIRKEEKSLLRNLSTLESQLNYVSTVFLKDGPNWLDNTHAISSLTNKIVKQSVVMAHHTHSRETYYFLKRFREG